MSHDRQRNDYHGNHQNSNTPRSNGIGTTNHMVSKSHPARSMDGTVEYESRTAHIELNGASTPTGLTTAPLNDSSSKRRHHRDDIDIPAGYPRQHIYDGETTDVIGPSVSILAPGSARQSKLDFYAEESDGGSVSKSYDVTTNQSDHSRKRETPQQRKVELLTYKQHPDTVEGDSFQERFVGETDMTLSQQETASEIDSKIMEMMRKRKISQGTSRTPKTTVLPTTKQSMKEVMNMAPERKKKISRAETKRLERKTVHGVPWESENKPMVELGRAESARRERDVILKKKLDKRRQKQVKPDAGIKLVGFRRVGDFCTSPPIPEEGEMTNVGMRQSSSLNFMPSDPVAMPLRIGRLAGGNDTISASNSFEFRAAFSPTDSRVSPTQEFRPPGVVDSGGPPVKQKLTAAVSVPVTPSTEERTVYRPNLQETHLSDVAVFGKHFDPSQLTQERMEMNVGDLSSVGLNQPSPLKKRGDRGKGTEFSSCSLKLEKKHPWGSRLQSESVSPKRKGKGGSEEGRYSGWEMDEVSAHAARHSSVLSTPSRYRMGRVSHNFREPVVIDESDVFAEELPQGSMPDIFRPTKSLSPSHRKSQGVKEGTPDSGTSDEEKPKKKRSIGYALGQKLSSSMRELFSKEKKNPISGTTWTFEVGSGLYPAPSEPQLSVLTEQERREIFEETEVVPRTRSTEMVSLGPHPQQQTSTPAPTSASGGNPLAHLFVPPAGMTIGKQITPSGFYEERSVDVGPRSPRKLVGSDDSASDSEEEYVRSSVNIITSSPPPESALREAGYFTGNEKRGERGNSPQTSLTSSQTGSTGPQTGLPTIVERSPDVFVGYEMPHSESAPIMKSLEGIVEKKPGKKGKAAKSTNMTKKDESKKEKKPIFRFTKSRTVIQRGSHIPRPASPLSVPGSKSGSPRSSGRLSPSQKPGTKTSTSTAAIKAANTESTRRGSKTSLGEPSSSPSGSFRGGRVSPFSPGGRGSPRGSFRGGAVSPLKSSIRSTTSATGPPGGLNSGKGRGANSPSPGGSTRSPRGSIQGGSPRGSGRGSKISPPGSGSPGLKTPSPKTSTQLNVSKKLSPVVTRRQPPSTSATSSAVKGKRRLSEPFFSPPLSSSPFSRSPNERHSNVSIGSHKPVRKAPPPPAKATQQKTLGTEKPSLSRTSSQASTGGGANSSSSSLSSPRHRRKGVSMSESPLTPKRLSAALIEKEAAAVTAAAADDVFKEEEDETEKLMKSIRQKLASLSKNPPPEEDLNPIDHQTQFEVPPPPEKATATATPLSPTGSEAKIPTYKLTPSGELKIEGEEGKKKVEEVEEDFTASLTPGSGRRGLRPKTVISALIGGLGKKKGAAGTVTTKDTSGSGGSFRKGKANTSTAEGSTETKAAASSLSEPKQKAVASTGKPPLRGGVSSGLPPMGPSVRGGKLGSGVGGGRSQSTIVVPMIQKSETRKSTRKVSSHATVGMSTSSGLRSSRGNALGSQGSLVRSSIRVSSKLKKNNLMSPEHRKISSLNRPRGGGERPPSRGSMHSLPRNSTAARVSVRRPVRVAPVAPGRAPSRKASTAVTSAAGNENRKTSMASNLDTRRTSVLSKSLRKTSTIRPKAEDSLHRSVATRSMRMSSSRRVSALGTMPRSSVVSKVAGGNLQTSSVAMPGVGSGAARKSMRKVSSQSKDVFDAFDKISEDAQGKLLTSSDHRRAVRPKLRQKASSAHLRLLRDREDVTTEMLTPSSDNSSLDSISYSTYMAKKNLAPSAVAGLSIKLDFTTVKLRKTGISDKMLMEKSTDISIDLPNFAVGAEYDTKHTTMLLQIKGRRHVHTRLVEPSVTSMNSGDVYIVVSGKSLYHWIGKSANVIEKARGSDVVMRIVHKKELGSQAMAPVVIKEEVRENSTLAKIEKFWQLLGGKRGVKSSESVPNDDLYEKSVNMVTTVMVLEGDSEDNAHFSTVHENSNHMLKIGILDANKILLLDFQSEVYVWVGKASPPKLRRKAIELAKKHFDAGCKPPVFTHQGAGGSTLIRASGRYRAKTSSTHNPRNSTLNRSGRRVSRVRKESAISTARPSWALFNRLNEGSEHILFREKFSDWPEQGRIIKMKGHTTTPVMPTGPVELQPADVEKMLRAIPKFEGLRLDGDNVHRGQGNYKVSRSTFACNRVHPIASTKWVIKDNDNVVVPEEEHGLFYAQEAYVVRWSYRITVVKELEGLSPGNGMFARERKMQQEKAAKDREVKDAQTNKSARGNDSTDTDSSGDEGEGGTDDESRRRLESGGRDKVAYFFWQGDECTVNEKGASALLTVELDKERGPQVRVVQNKEPPAFLNLFSGGMVLLCGRSETMSFKSPARPVRLFLVRGQTRSEACLVEIDPEHWPMAKFLRSRGCYVVYDSPGNKIYLWKGCRVTPTLRKVSHTAARLLKRRLKADLVMVEEGQEPKDMCALIGDKASYDSLLNDTRLIDYTPRLFELSSTTGEFVASELLYPARGCDAEATPFFQSDLYTTHQPAIFLLDAYRTVYVWLGWWPQERRDWSIMRETNITTGSAHARWLRDKKLALETAQLYAKASTETRKHQPKTYMIHAGTEPDHFVHIFPFWKPHAKVQELQCNGRKPIPQRVNVEQELLKYSRTQFTLTELQKRPLPEGVDPARLESYISDEEFKSVFGITREQFKRFPAWKQTDIKKVNGLF